MISDSNTWDALSNARKKKYILQQAQEKNTDSYLLTEDGVEFARRNLKKVKDFDQGKTRIPISKELYDNTKLRLISSSAYKKAREDKLEQISQREYNDFFIINDYMKNIKKNEKIQKLKNLFISDKELKIIIDKIASIKIGVKKNGQ